MGEPRSSGITPGMAAAGAGVAGLVSACVPRMALVLGFRSRSLGGPLEWLTFACKSVSSKRGEALDAARHRCRLELLCFLDGDAMPWYSWGRWLTPVCACHIVGAAARL